MQTRTSAAIRSVLAGCGLAAALMTASTDVARADEGGVSFWVPGFFGSLAAAPVTPGFAFASIYYHTSVEAGADVAFARQVTRGNLTVNFTGNVNINLNAQADLVLATPSYTFAERFLGGQAQIVMLIPYGRARTSVDGTLTGNLGLGGPGFTIGASTTDTAVGFGDLVPQFNMRWNAGVHNFMTYVTGNITVGKYSASSLANLGIGHNAFDAGGGYTYFNPETGHEFSGVLGFTYNFENDFTQYKNGIDSHFDWGASKWLNKQFFVGAVGYAYQQLTCDSGAGDRVGCFESRVFGIGPQVGLVIPMNEHYQGYFNAKAYGEFGSEPPARGLERVAHLRDFSRPPHRRRRCTIRWCGSKPTFGTADTDLQNERRNPRSFDRGPCFLVE